MRLYLHVLVLGLALAGCREDVLVVQDGAAIDVNTLQLDFGEANIGERSELRVLVTNVGEQPLIVEELNFQPGGPFFGSVTQAPLEISRNQSVELTLYFFPVDPQLYLGGVDIRSNAENLSSVRIELKGQGRDWSICTDCSSPPQPSCVTEEHRLVYEEQGDCEGDNQCRFAVGVETCAEICLNGTCVGGIAGADGGIWCGPGDPDGDGDGICDSDDNCAQISNPTQADADEDGRGDLCDVCDGFDDFADDDEDEVPNGCDICTAGDDSADTDNDSVPDACDRCEGHLDHLDEDEDGTPDGCDVCAEGSDALDTDDDQVPNACDRCPGEDDQADEDNDGIPDGCDLCPLGDDELDADGDGIPNACDTCQQGVDEEDEDFDGVPDACDLCPGHSDNLDTDGDNVPDGCDICSEGSDIIDNDNDDIPDACDSCPGANNNYDSDSDGVPNGCDVCPEGPDHVDSDGDGVPNACDVCPALSSSDQSDYDSDGVGDLCDNCPQISNPTQENQDSDQWGDACDRCPYLVHANDQTDTDQDGVGDLCDVCAGFDDRLDTDGDEIPNGCDNCPDENSYNQTDSDGDGVGDVCDQCPGSDDNTDVDGDAVPDACDVCTLGPNGLDSDGDGVANACDVCPAGDDAVDADADTVPDACDLCPEGDDLANADGDNHADACDACPLIANEDPTDNDNDGIPNVCDACPELPNGDGTDVDGDGRDDQCVQATCLTGMGSWAAVSYPFSESNARFDRYANCTGPEDCPSSSSCVDSRCTPPVLSIGTDGGSAANDPSEWVVTDAHTGLTWQGCVLGLTGAGCASGEVLRAPHADLAANCSDLNYQRWGGFASGWRMATLQELMTLVDYSHVTPFIQAEFFPNSEVTVFSGTSKANQRETYAYALNMVDDGTIYGQGTVVPRAKSAIDVGTRCVRVEEPPQRCFSDVTQHNNGTGEEPGSTDAERTVIDYASQLEWQEGFWGWRPSLGWQYNLVGLGNYVGSREDFSQCDNGNPCCNLFDGRTDWRQPTIGELASLIFTGIPQTGAPNWPQSVFGSPEGIGSTLFFWSKSRFPNSLSRRWGVDFYSNVDLVLWRENNGVFKCVRDVD